MDQNHKIYSVERNSFKRIYVVRNETDRKSKQHHVQITYGLTLGHELEKPRKEERNKNVQPRNQNSNMSESWVELFFLIRVIKSTKTSLVNAIRKIETPMTAAMSCKRETFQASIRETGVSKTGKENN